MPLRRRTPRRCRAPPSPGRQDVAKRRVSPPSPGLARYRNYRSIQQNLICLRQVFKFKDSSEARPRTGEGRGVISRCQVLSAILFIEHRAFSIFHCDAMTPDEPSNRHWDFAAQGTKVVDALPDTRTGWHIAGQPIRCGTAEPPNDDEDRRLMITANGR